MPLEFYTILLLAFIVSMESFITVSVVWYEVGLIEDICVLTPFRAYSVYNCAVQKPGTVLLLIL